MLPSLMLLGLPPEVANGTTRPALIAQSLSAMAIYQRHTRLEGGVVSLLVAPAVVGALLGAWLASSVVPRELLKPVLLLTLSAVALVMLRPRRKTQPNHDEPSRVTRPRAGELILMGITGVYGGFVQAGVGFLLLGVLHGLARRELIQANAIKLVCVLVFSTAALVVFVVANQVEWVSASALAIGATVGGQLGGRYGTRANPDVLKRVIAACVVAALVGAALR